MAIQPKERLAGLNLSGLDHASRRPVVEEPIEAESADLTIPPPPPRPALPQQTSLSPSASEGTAPSFTGALEAGEKPTAALHDVESEDKSNDRSQQTESEPAKRPRRSSRKPASRTTLLLYRDQRSLLRQMSKMLDLHMTVLFADAVNRHADQIRQEGKIIPPPRRPSGPRPEELTAGCVIELIGDLPATLKRLAKSVSEGNISAVARRVVDLEAHRLGLPTDKRPTVGLDAGHLVPLGE